MNGTGFSFIYCALMSGTKQGATCPCLSKNKPKEQNWVGGWGKMVYLVIFTDRILEGGKFEFLVFNRFFRLF